MHDWMLVSTWMNFHNERWSKWICMNCNGAYSSRFDSPPDPYREWKFTPTMKGSCGDYMIYQIMEG